jgi:PPE-repeat protein
MFYGAFQPEFNSARMYAGPGAGSLLAAAASWDDLATELQSTASSYSSVISSLTSGPWVGPSSLSMAAAVTPYVAWMQGTAGQAHEAAMSATAAADAYQTAFAAHVPPSVIAENRTLLAQLVATNVLGQNTAAIAANEAQYSEFWAQDALAMDTYVSSSEAATSQLTQFTEPPQTTNTAAAPMQTAAMSTAAASPAGSVASTLSSIIPTITPEPGALGGLAGLANAYTKFWDNLLNAIGGSNGSAWYTALYNSVKVPLGLTTPYNDIGLLINFPMSQWLKFSPPIA